MRTYLCAPLAQDRLKLVDCLVVCLERIQLCLRECGRLRGRRTQRDRSGLRIRCERPPGCDRSERLDEVAPSHIHSLGSARSSTIRLQIEHAVRQTRPYAELPVLALLRGCVGVRFSNRTFGVKRFQTTHHHSVGHGLVHSTRSPVGCYEKSCRTAWTTPALCQRS